MAWSVALGELRELLRGIEEEDVDLDVLSARVARAAALIRACRARIQRTEMSVRAVLDELEREKEEP
jgi:exodeoxyribonuclease VII small subunit